MNESPQEDNPEVLPRETCIRLMDFRQKEENVSEKILFLIFT